MTEYTEENNLEVLISRSGDRFYYFNKKLEDEIVVDSIRFSHSQPVELIYGKQFRLLDGKLFSIGENSYDVMVLGVQDGN